MFRSVMRSWADKVWEPLTKDTTSSDWHVPGVHGWEDMPLSRWPTDQPTINRSTESIQSIKIPPAFFWRNWWTDPKIPIEMQETHKTIMKRTKLEDRTFLISELTPKLQESKLWCWPKNRSMEQNWKSRYKPLYSGPIIFKRVPRPLNAKKILFSTSDAWTTEYPHAGEWSWTPNLLSMQKLTQNEANTHM